MVEESFEQLNQKQCAAYLKKAETSTGRVYPGVSGQADPGDIWKKPFENLDLVRTHELIQTDLDTVY